MKRWQLILAATVVALLAGVGGYQLQQQLNPKPEAVVEAAPQKSVSAEEVIGTVAEEFSLSGMDGKPRHSSEWKGKVMVINFWATWCPPCREEIPYFIELQEQYAAQGLQFVGVALQQADEVRDFLDEFGVNYPSLVGGDDVIQLATKLGNGIGALPYTVVIDRGRKIAFTRRGPLSKEDAESVIQALL